MKTSIQDNAMKIVRCFRSKTLKDSTVKNLINETQISNDLEFYNGLDWLTLIQFPALIFHSKAY